MGRIGEYIERPFTTFRHWHRRPHGEEMVILSATAVHITVTIGVSEYSTATVSPVPNGIGSGIVLHPAFQAVARLHRSPVIS